MADTVTTQIIIDTKTNIVVHLTNLSDATGETNVKKVDIATLTNYFSVKPNGLSIEQVRWCINGMTSVKIGWDRTAAQNTAMLLSNNGYDDFRGMIEAGGAGGGVTDRMKLAGLADPSDGNADGKGSILLSTVGAASGGTYDITLWLRKTPNKTAT